MQDQIATETAEREAEKKENLATIKDAEDAQTAVSQAVAVLKDFYKGTGEVPKESWEFSQMGAAVRRVRAEPGETEEPEPELWESKPYTGTEGGSAVIGMLENIATDFAAMESKAKADELEQQDEYDKWLTDTKIDISVKKKDSEMKA